MDPNITCAGSVLLAGWSVIDTLLVSAAAIAVKCMRWASLPWAENCVRESKLVVRSEGQRALGIIIELIASVCPKRFIVNISTSHPRSSPRVWVSQYEQAFL